MSIKTTLIKIAKNPLGVLGGTLLGGVALFTSVPMFKSGMYAAALVDLIMAAILIKLFVKSTFTDSPKVITLWEKSLAWLILISGNIIAVLPTYNLASNINTIIAFTFLICALFLYFKGIQSAAFSIAPSVWCCIFMPYHEEVMLLLSFPLRLSATVLSAITLNLVGVKVIHSGTSLTLPEIQIAITDSCSGIEQLDAFILIAFIAVQLLHKKAIWKILHFAFIVPCIIVGNSMRIVLTVLLYQCLGETVLENTWHTALGYTQIVFALLIFLGIGKIFNNADKKTMEEQL